MKKLSFYSLALAGLMLGACSNELDVNSTSEGGVPQGEKGYISLSVNLPTQMQSGRANDNFDQGDAVEYNVKDATLLLFAGSDEASATFAGAYDLVTNFSDGTTGNITTSSKIVQQITNPSNGSNKIYALVVLNKTGLLSKSGNDWSYGPSSAPLTLNTTTFSEFAYTAQTLQLSDIANTADNGNFLMLNAPLYSKAGGVTDPTASGTLTTLTEIDKNNIFSTSTQAEQNPAARIFVERAVAKVTVKNTAYDAGTYQADLKGWTLDITNKNMFPVRKLETGWWSYKHVNSQDYRFVGASAVATDRFRTYWGVDPNYNGNDNSSYVDADKNVVAGYNGFNVLSGTAPTALTEIGSNAYCMENTFDVNNMRKDQTTRVIVAAQLTVPGADENKDFYVLNNVKSTIYKKADLINEIKKAYLQNNTIDGLLHDPSTGLDLQDGEQFGADDLIVKFKSDETVSEEFATLNGGNVTVAEVYVNPASNTKFKNDQIPAGLAANNTTVTAELNTYYKIAYYKGGVAYYPVMIRHFDENQTPWSEEGLTESYPNTDGKAASNWLGRYGVLRNNWYEIEVTKVNNIGSAEVEPEYGYDDPLESWISVEINILSWAKRTQNVEL